MNKIVLAVWAIALNFSFTPLNPTGDEGDDIIFYIDHYNILQGQFADLVLFDLHFYDPDLALHTVDVYHLMRPYGGHDEGDEYAGSMFYYLNLKMTIEFEDQNKGQGGWRHAESVFYSVAQNEGSNDVHLTYCELFDKDGNFLRSTCNRCAVLIKR